jgi:hypothetical protein
MENTFFEAEKDAQLEEPQSKFPFVGRAETSFAV